MVIYGPGAQAFLFNCLRLNGLRVVSSPAFFADSGNLFLTYGRWWVIHQKLIYLWSIKVSSSNLAASKKSTFFR